MSPREITPEEFTDERFGTIFRQMGTESGHPERYKPQHFIPTWQSWIKLGFARTWEVPKAVLGAVYTDDLFSGQKRASVMFWASLPEIRNTGLAIKLLNQFESESKKAECSILAAAAHAWLHPNRLVSVYKARGYEITEFIFSKEV